MPGWVPDDLPRLVRLFAEGEKEQGDDSTVARVIWAIRWKLGELLGWDEAPANAPTLHDRLPADLRDAPSGPRFAALPFTPLFLLHDEYAAELVNRTVHSILHLGWVPDGAGGHRGQMAVLVRPCGRFGAAYMAAILPFRRLLIYPVLMRQLGRDWRAAPLPVAA